MALMISGQSPCSICGEVLAVDDEVVGFFAFLTREHPLWRYSDSAMHAGCYAAWPERPLFDSLYAEAEARRQEARTPARMAEARKQQDEERAAQLERDREHNESHARMRR